MQLLDKSGRNPYSSTHTVKSSLNMIFNYVMNGHTASYTRRHSLGIGLSSDECATK